MKTLSFVYALVIATLTISAAAQAQEPPLIPGHLIGAAVAGTLQSRNTANPVELGTTFTLAPLTPLKTLAPSTIVQPARSRVVTFAQAPRVTHLARVSYPRPAACVCIPPIPRQINLSAVRYRDVSDASKPLVRLSSVVSSSR